MSKFVVVVPEGRRAAGRGVLLGENGRVRLGPLAVLATASDAVAARHGNPERDWREPFGDTPTGSYVIAGALPPGAARRGSGAEFGLLGALALAPAAGNALVALRAGRIRFLLHGGPLDSNGLLRPTCGGLRVSDADLVALVRAINEANADGDALSSVEVAEVPSAAWVEERDADAPSRPDRSRRAPVPRKTRVGLGFGAGLRRKGSDRARTEQGRRDFLGLALVVVPLLASACGGIVEPEMGGQDGDDGGGPDGGYDAALDASASGDAKRDGPGGEASIGEGGPCSGRRRTGHGSRWWNGNRGR